MTQMIDGNRPLSVFLVLMFAAALLVAYTPQDVHAQKKVKVGILHSLSGPISIQGSMLKDSEMLAIEEINENGGVLGRKIEPVVADGASDPSVYAEKARKLWQQDNVATVFCCTASNTRKGVKPVAEGLDELLWYPTYYEGYESSPNIIYTGAPPNVCITPAIGYLLQEGYEDIYLLGSDYVWSRLANLIAQKMIGNDPNARVVKEEYAPIGHQDFSSVINEIKSKKPDAILGTVIGSSQVAFMKQLNSAGISAKDIPVMGIDTGERFIKENGADLMKGHLVASSYFMSLKNRENQQFIKAFKEKYGQDRVTSMYMEAAYWSVYLWKKAVEKAGTFDPKKVREAAAGLGMMTPEGYVRIDPQNYHVWTTARVGRIGADGQIHQIWSTGQPIAPDPYLKGFSWGDEIQVGK